MPLPHLIVAKWNSFSKKKSILVTYFRGCVWFWTRMVLNGLKCFFIHNLSLWGREGQVLFHRYMCWQSTVSELWTSNRWPVFVTRYRENRQKGYMTQCLSVAALTGALEIRRHNITHADLSATQRKDLLALWIVMSGIVEFIIVKDCVFSSYFFTFSSISFDYCSTHCKIRVNL